MHVGVMGAGSIGCYIGGRLAAGGFTTTLVGRANLADEVAQNGMSLTDCDGFSAHIAPERIQITPDVGRLKHADCILVTVKSLDTAAVGAELAACIPKDALVISFQNGVRNVDVLRAALPGRTVLAGMVPYNVVRKPKATFHRGTSGSLVIEASDATQAASFFRALGEVGLAFEVSRDVEAVQWGKLLVNINNPVNALVGIPLLEQLRSRELRRVVAALMEEGSRVLSAANVKAVSSLKVPPFLVPHALRLPNGLFKVLAGAMLKIDPQARSSMWEDLERRRPTEVDYLNGEIVRLAAEHNVNAPLNERMQQLVHAAEKAGQGSPKLSATALTSALGMA